MHFRATVRVKGRPGIGTAMARVRQVIPEILREEGATTAKIQRAAYTMTLQKRLRPWHSRHGALSWRMHRDIRSTVTIQPDRWWLRVGVQSIDPMIRMIAALKNRPTPTVIRAKYRQKLAIPLRALEEGGGLARYGAVGMARIHFTLRFTRWAIWGRPRVSGTLRAVKGAVSRKLFLRRSAVTFPNAPFIPQFADPLVRRIAQRIRETFGTGRRRVLLP